MSPAEPTPVSKSPFWRFSVKFYGEPGVAQACIDLQDQVGVDVNVLFAEVHRHIRVAIVRGNGTEMDDV